MKNIIVKIGFIICFSIILTACKNRSANNKLLPEPKPMPKGAMSDTTLNHDSAVDAAFEKFPKEKLQVSIQNFLSVNNIKKWTTIKTISLEGETTEGGEATYYFSGDTLQKIVAKQYGETFKVITEYYLINEKLSFVYEIDVKYNKPITWDSAHMKENKDNEVFDITKSTLLEKRSYFVNGVLIHQSNNQNYDAQIPESYLKQENKNISEAYKSLLNKLKQQK